MGKAKLQKRGIKISDILVYVSVLSLVYIYMGIAQGAPSQSEKDKTREKEELATTSSAVKSIQGEVSAINKNGIAIVISRNPAKGEENEIYLPLEKEKLQILHRNRLEEIQVGDTVEVKYEVITEGSKEGRKSRFNGKTIRFIRAGVKKPVPAEEPPTETSDDAEEEALPLKGIR